MLKVLNKSLKYIYKTKSVWWYTASAKTRARYVRTIIGSFWLGISNLLFIICLGFFYGIILNVNDFINYFIYLGIGYSVWTIIGGSINSAPEIFSSKSNDLINSNIDSLFYVMEEWCFQIQTFFQSFFMVIIFLGFLDHSVLINSFIYTPIHLINISLFIFWAPLTVCLLAARYTDFYQLVPVATQLIFLISPILYQEKNLGKFSFLSDLNPIYKVLALFRDSIIEGKFFFKGSMIILLINLIMSLISLLILNKYKKRLVFYFS